MKNISREKSNISLLFLIDINLIGMGTKEIAKDERITRVKKIREKSAFFSSKDNVLSPKALRFL